MQDYPGTTPLCWAIAEDDTHWFGVRRMLFNWRAWRAPKSHPWEFDGEFCYQGTGEDTLLKANVAALVWSRSGLDEPPGWNRNVYTHEWRDN